MKINIKRIIFFLVIIYWILIVKNSCNAAPSHRESCEFCKKNITGSYTATHITEIPIKVNDNTAIDFGRTGYSIKVYYIADRANIMKFESQANSGPTKGKWVSNKSGSGEVPGDSNDFIKQKIGKIAMNSGNILVYYENSNMAGKQLYGYHYKVSDVGLDNTDDSNSTTMEDVTKNINGYKPGDIDSGSASKIESKTSKILTVISNIGIAISVIILAILGVKYMFGSVEDKAEYKQDMIPYIIGALLLFGITGFLKILIAIGEKIGTT